MKPKELRIRTFKRCIMDNPEISTLIMSKKITIEKEVENENLTD